MQNAELECKISICCEQIKHMCKYAELECRIRTEQNKRKNEKTANSKKNQNRTEFNTEKIRTKQKYEQNSELDQNRTENITEFRITAEQNEKQQTANKTKQNRIRIEFNTTR